MITSHQPQTRVSIHVPDVSKTRTQHDAILVGLQFPPVNAMQMTSYVTSVELYSYVAGIYKLRDRPLRWHVYNCGSAYVIAGRRRTLFTQLCLH